MFMPQKVKATSKLKDLLNQIDVLPAGILGGRDPRDKAEQGEQDRGKAHSFTHRTAGKDRHAVIS